MNAGEIFAWLWIVYLIVMLFIVIGVILWAKRNNQFKQQPNASNLPLEIDDPTNLKNKNHVSRPA